MTMFFFSKPSDFKWTALVSFISVIAGLASYAIYANREHEREVSAHGYIFVFDDDAQHEGRSSSSA